VATDILEKTTGPLPFGLRFEEVLKIDRATGRTIRVERTSDGNVRYVPIMATEKILGVTFDIRPTGPFEDPTWDKQ
jgi:hypothetical protein